MAPRTSNTLFVPPLSVLLTLTSPSPAPSRRTTSTSSLAPTSSPSRLRPHRTTLNNPDWAEAVAETFEGDEVMASGSGGGAKGKGRVRETTPAAAHEEQEAPVLEGRVLRERKTPSKVSGFSSSSSAALPAAKGDLRSFFNRASPRKKRRLSSPSSDGDDLAPPMSRSSTSSSSTSASSAFSNATTVSTSSSKPLSKSSSKPVKLEQLYLDPFETAGRSTLSCTVCSLSYARTPDDQAFHAKHHKKVVSGCDWNVGEEARGVTVLEDGVEWGGKEGGKVLMVDYPVTDAATKRKVRLRPLLYSLPATDRIDLTAQGRPRNDRYRTLLNIPHSLSARREQGLPLRHPSAQGLRRRRRTAYQGRFRRRYESERLG